MMAVAVVISPTMFVNGTQVPITTANTQAAAIQMFTDAVNKANGS